VPFFGRLASTTKAVALLSLKHRAVILVLGSVFGAGLGLAMAAAVVLGRRGAGPAGTIDAGWAVTWPWPALGLLVVVLPVLTLAGVWLLTPAQLPVTRRLAG
jgi:hypothetical protein